MSAASMKKDDDPRAPETIVAGVLGAILVFAIIVGLQALFYTMQDVERGDKVIKVAPEELTRLRAEQTERIGQYRWVDPVAGVATLPIERAMELTVRDQGRLPNATVAPPGAAAGPGGATGTPDRASN